MQNHLFGFLFVVAFAILPNAFYAQPNADFSVDKSEGCAPISVNFSDLSTFSNGLTSWSWEINGIPFSTNQNPSYLINDAGTYTICLTVEDDQGQTDKTCKNNFIEVYAKPVANFDSDIKEGCRPLEVNFTSTSSASGSQITSWVWDLGGPCGIIPGTSNATVSCIYDTPGTFKPTLIVTDENGCEAAITKNDWILVYPDPTLEITSDFSFACTPPFTVNFTNENPEANTTYSWDFGDGQMATGAFPPPITYNGNGPYTVTISAVNQETGCTNTVVLEDYITVGNEVDFSFDSDAGCGDLNVNFSDLSPVGAAGVEWDFGDGNSSNVTNPTHTYPGPGCYTVILSRTVNGCTNSLERLLCITDPANLNVAVNILNPQGCEEPFVAQFQGISPVAESWLWDFGDGTTSTEQSPTHTYNSFGTYPVSLTVTDPFGCQRTLTEDTVVIEEMELHLANLPIQGCLPLSISLVDSVETLGNIVSWKWSVEDLGGNVIFSSTQTSPSFTLNDEGCYNVILEVTNDLGCVQSETFSNAICGGNQPTANFSASPLTTCADRSVSFVNLSDTTVNSWAWDFDGDGEFDSFESDPMYQYRDTGCFDVTLMVGSNGCFDLITFPEYICILPPVARFNVGRNCDDPFYRRFVSKAIGADSIIWDFGVPGIDTDVSNLINPIFNYPYKDTFEVTQVVFNFDSGCTDTLRKNVFIKELKADFSLATVQGCAPMELQITNSSQDANRYLWASDGAVISNFRSRVPRITYPDAGAYALRLIALDINNCRDTMILDPIYANEIDIDFNSSQLTPCLPVDVRFVDNSTNLYANNIQWDWAFGDSSAIIGTASGQDIVYTFDQAGFIPTQLTVTDSWGCTDSIYVRRGIDIDAPFASFEVDSFSCPGLVLQFDNKSGGANLSYDWDFGDGTASTQENPTHEYDLGNYQASLTISTANCTHTSIQEIQVEEVIADFSVDPDYSPCPPATVLFNDLSTNAADWEWSFGDNSGTSDQPSHIYTSRGYFDIRLIALGKNAACQDTMYRDSAVAILGPSGDFSFAVDNTCLPAEVTLIGASDRPYNYTWFLDDGSTIVTPNTTNDTIVYTYTELTPMGYLPKLMLASTCDTVLVSPDTLFLSDLSIDFVASDTFLCDGDRAVGFESLINSTSPDYQVNWIFDGGISATSDQVDIGVEYTQPGIFDVTLQVDNGDCQDTLVKEEYIEVVERLVLEAEDPAICNGDTVQLVVSSNATEFEWTPLESIIDPQEINPSVHPDVSTDYLVSGNYKSCNAISDTISVTVYELPQVVYAPERRFFPGQSIMLEVKPRDGVSTYSYDWFPTTGLSCSNCPNPTASLDTNMVYTITITDRETGCSTYAVMSVSELKDCPEDLIYMPTAFSPNDDGNNDDFRMYSSNITEIDYFRIYDRWGALLWETNDINEGWDGRVKGVLANSGVYVYSLEAPCVLNDKKILKKGGITLMR